MPRLLIRGGTLHDGTGAAPRLADLLVDAERILDVVAPGEDRIAAAGGIIEAAGLAVCPGFIDIHSHGDLIFTLPPDSQRALLAGRIGQGITSEIVGNCGLGVFPCTSATEETLRAVSGWMTPKDAASWPAGRWSDLESYLAHLESNGVWVNVGTLQPHGPLRIEAAGLSCALPGIDGAEALARMTRRLTQALDAGAFGLSTGLIYPPGIYTPTDEIVALARALAGRCGDSAFVASHIRGSSETLLPAVEELLDVGRRAGARVQHSHNEAVGREHWPKIERVLEKEDAARRSGVAVSYDMFPYTAAATMMLAIYPPWSLEGGVSRLLDRLADPASRAAIRESIEKITPSWPPWIEGGWPHNLVKAVGWDLITIGSVASELNRRLEGMSLAQLGRATGRSPFDAVSDLMLEERGMVSQIIHGISGEEGRETGIETLLSHPAGCICTDANDFGKGRPHPAAYGTYPRVLGRYVRERKLMTLQAAIHKMTGAPAALLGLKDRGVVRPGAFADLVIFDPETVGSEATFDDPRRLATGIISVLINGNPVLVQGSDAPTPPIANRPAGKVLRRPG